MVMPVLNFDQGAGLKWLQGTGAGANIMQNLLDYPNKRAQLAEQLKGEQLANQLAETKLPFVPEQLAAQTALAQTQVPLTQAQTQQTQVKTGLLPVSTDIAAYNAALKAQQLGQSRQMAPSRTLYSIVRAMSLPEVQQLFADNPQFAQSVMQGLRNSSLQLQGGAGQGETMPLPATLQARLGMQNVPQVPIAGAESPVGPLTPEALQKLQSTAGAAVQKKITPGPIQSQRYYGQLADSLLNQVAPRMDLISEFAGTAGKLKRGVEGAEAALGKNSPQFRAWSQFKIQAPLIANEIRRKLGGQATEQETKLMSNLINPQYYDSNPQIALDQFNTLLKASQAADVVLSKNLGQITQSSQETGAPLTVPTFNTPQDFKTWYMGLSPIKQFQYQEMLKAQQEGKKK